MRILTLKALLAVSAAMLISGPALAGDEAGRKGGHHSEWAEKMKDMTPEERKAFMEERKAKWEALSTEEKVQMIEEKRAERREAMDEKWESMSDEDKVKYVEEKMKRKFHHRKKHMQDRHGAKDGAENTAE